MPEPAGPAPLSSDSSGLAAESQVPPHVDRVLDKPPRLKELRAALAALVRRA